MSSGISNLKKEIFFSVLQTSYSIGKEDLPMISYEPFWDLLDWREISTYTLINKHHISSSRINRLRHNLPISTATIDKLCEIFDCPVDDIIMYVKNEQGA